MIIDQLPLLLGDALLTDEFPIERGTTSYKAKLEQILGLAFSALEPNFAGAYDSTATYSVGDYVVYEHDLYVCNTAISTAEAWTAAHWTQTDIGTVLESLKSDIDTLGTNKQDKITASGILKGSGSAVSAATLGTDYGARVFQFTLAAADWSNNEQTISSNWLQASGFVYLIEPVQASKAEYGSAGIYADDVFTQYQITFHCTTTPTSDLSVNVCRIVSANNKTINIAGGGSSDNVVTLSPTLTKTSGGASAESVSAVQTGRFVQVTMSFRNGNSAVTPSNNAFIGTLSDIPLPAGNTIGPSYSGGTAFMCLIDPEGGVVLRVLAANFAANADVKVSVLYIA